MRTARCVARHEIYTAPSACRVPPSCRGRFPTAACSLTFSCLQFHNSTKQSLIRPPAQLAEPSPAKWCPDRGGIPSRHWHCVGCGDEWRDDNTSGQGNTFRISHPAGIAAQRHINPRDRRPRSSERLAPLQWRWRRPRCQRPVASRTSSRGTNPRRMRQFKGYGIEIGIRTGRGQPKAVKERSIPRGLTGRRPTDNGP
jgi:hypothetical protein